MQPSSSAAKGNGSSNGKGHDVSDVEPEDDDESFDKYLTLKTPLRANKRRTPNKLNRTLFENAMSPRGQHLSVSFSSPGEFITAFPFSACLTQDNQRKKTFIAQ